jgi:hypothetical protein
MSKVYDVKKGISPNEVIKRGDVVHFGDDVVIVDIAEFPICDDCREAYLTPAYYVFEPEGCTVDDEGTPHEGCTGNLCPACAGPYLEPDKPDDPRRPRA